MDKRESLGRGRNILESRVDMTRLSSAVWEEVGWGEERREPGAVARKEGG